MVSSLLADCALRTRLAVYAIIFEDVSLAALVDNSRLRADR